MERIYLCLLLCVISIVCIHCDSSVEISQDIVEQHAEMTEKINNYLAAHEGVSGFTGQVFCENELLGGNDSIFYVTILCQEYYVINGDSVSEGTGFHTPAVLFHQNKEITDIERPLDGSGYTSSIKQMFPNHIAKKVLSDGHMTSSYQAKVKNMEIHKSDVMAQWIEDKTIYDQIADGSMKAIFQAGGVEPFWSAYLLEEKLLVVNSMVLSSYKLLTKFNLEIDHQVLQFTNNRGLVGRFEIKKESTFEELSNQTYPYKVQLEINGQDLRGVGNVDSL